MPTRTTLAPHAAADDAFEASGTDAAPDAGPASETDPGPFAEHHPGDGGPCAAVARFRSPATRLLLGGDGLTTTLLESWAGSRMRVGDVTVDLVRPERAPRGAAALLGAAGGDLLVRHSTLSDARGRLWSWNQVVAGPAGAGDPALRRCLTDVSAPLGPALRAAGARLGRAVVRAGVTPWPGRPGEPGGLRGPGSAAAFRTYRLWCGDDVLAAVREVFNPAHVPAELREPAP